MYQVWFFRVFFERRASTSSSESGSVQLPVDDGVGEVLPGRAGTAVDDRPVVGGVDGQEAEDRDVRLARRERPANAGEQEPERLLVDVAEDASVDDRERADAGP